jgi:branched-chain amino acid transport system substrate-binding protein
MADLMCRFRLTLLLAGLATSWSLGGCPGRAGPDFGRLPTITSDNPRAEADLQAARELDERGDQGGALTAYRRFIAQYTRDPLVPVAQLGLGRILLSKGELQEANTLFELVERHPDAALAEQGRFYGAVASHRLGDHQHAVERLQPLVGRPIDPADTSLLLRTLGEALVALGRYGDAIAIMDALAVEERVPANDRQWAREQVAALARDKASVEEIERLTHELSHRGVAWRHVIRRALRDADAAGDAERVRELLGILREDNLPLDEELSTIAARAEHPTEANPKVVGAVLSLSGRGRGLGEVALRGLMLAAGLPPEGPASADTPQIVFRDDGGDPQRAADAVSDLVASHRAIAVIGPLDVRAADAAAERAQQLGVPIVLLTPGGNATARGPMVFRYFASIEDELSELLQWTRVSGKSRVAALLPEGAYGDFMDDTLRAKAASMNLSVQSVQRYPLGATSFADQVKALARHQFDTLLVADGPTQVALLAPALAAAGLWSTLPGREPPMDGRAISVIAPSVGFDHGLARSVSRYLQGAVFSVPFDALTATATGEQFVERFQAQFGEAPNAFAAFAYDAYKLVRRGVDVGGNTRERLAATLPRVESFELAGPGSGFASDREPRRATRLLQLEGSQFHRIEQQP